MLFRSSALLLSLGLCSLALSAQQAAPRNAPATWMDPATHLLWAAADNGSDLTWPQAAAYCSSFRAAEATGWRLPTIDELESLYDSTVSVPARADYGQAPLHVKKEIKLTGWVWSSTPADSPHFMKIFNFFDPSPNVRRTYNGFPDQTFHYNTRALCVTSSAEAAPANQEHINSDR